MDRRLDEIRFNQGVMLSRLGSQIRSRRAEHYEFKVFSQGGEDGIIQHLTRCIPIANKTFIEFGVEDFSEANCRFLMMKDGWQGYVIDGSSKNIDRLRGSRDYWKYQLRARASFITRDNIAALLDESGFDKDLGLLSIDIDGMDYYVLERLAAYRPRILVVEYNAVFGGDRAVLVPYDSHFQRSKARYSQSLLGCELTSVLLPGISTRLRGYDLASGHESRRKQCLLRSLRPH